MLLFIYKKKGFTMKNNISKYLCNDNITIKDSLSLIQKSGHNTIFVVDKKKKLLGSLSDGDIRRALLINAKINSTIKNIYKEKINLLPIISNNKKITNVISWEEVFTKEKNIHKSSALKNFSVIIMAGGKGTRLRPYTNILPKPLLPINNKAIIEYIIDNFRLNGARNIQISINSMSKIIKSFVSEKNYSKEILFVEEKKPLGTCGSLSLINKKKLTNEFILSNCDVIYDIDYNSLIRHHKQSKALMTLVVSNKNFELSYGSIKIDKYGFLESIDEKPNLDFLINIGLYIMNKEILNYIKKNISMDINQLINILKKNKKNISVFEISEKSWIDTGQMKELKNAKDILEF